MAMYGPNAKNVTFIQDFIDFEKLWEESFLKIPVPHITDQTSFMFGCVGRLAEQKNQGLVIRVLAKMRDKGFDVRLVFHWRGNIQGRVREVD